MPKRRNNAKSLSAFQNRHRPGPDRPSVPLEASTAAPSTNSRDRHQNVKFYRLLQHPRTNFFQTSYITQYVTDSEGFRSTVQSLVVV